MPIVESAGCSDLAAGDEGVEPDRLPAVVGPEPSSGTSAAPPLAPSTSPSSGCSTTSTVDFDELVDLYAHEGSWSNRRTHGDALLVMNSLAEIQLDVLWATAAGGTAVPPVTGRSGAPGRS